MLATTILCLLIPALLASLYTLLSPLIRMELRLRVRAQQRARKEAIAALYSQLKLYYQPCGVVPSNIHDMQTARN